MADQEAYERAVTCLEACRYFGNPAALPAVIDAVADLVEAVKGTPAPYCGSIGPCLDQLEAALKCLEIHEPDE